ncbi:flagellar biosynthetic protein FliO [Pseudomonas sp. RIT-PI-S]|uniref:flagellar biosynthetic protein FliO n=1 Tax=Pseudomonas sp. RIT-PI-S TaxID=3035295 RepID=UPI0021D7DA54|nr:flagellar biosynthetic protein FliO [Pseudomonas sp. RIT-PI-S]
MKAWLAGLAGLPLLAMAAEPAPAAGAVATPAAPALGAGSGMAAQLGQTALGLFAVVVVILALAWLLRRVQQVSPRGGQVIELLGSRALGPRDRLVLVQVGQEQILLGLSPGRITPLHVLEHPVDTPRPGEAAAPEFAQRLMELLGKDHKDRK